MRIAIFLIQIHFFIQLIWGKLMRFQLTPKKTSYRKHPTSINSSSLLHNSHYMSRIRLLDYELTQYSGQIKISESFDVFEVIFDTGSSYLWVASTSCTSCKSYGLTEFFDCDDSDSCDDSDTLISISYGTGSLSGYFVTDNVQIGDLTSEDQEFIDVTELMGFDSFGSNGILGLGLSAAAEGHTTLIDNLQLQGEISNRIFSFYLGGKTGSYLPQFTIDGYDERLIQNGSNITYCPLNDVFYWGVEIISIYLQSADENFSVFDYISSDISEAIVDSGTSLLVLDSASFQLIFQYLNEITQCFLLEGFIVCSETNLTKYPDIVINLCGNEFILEPQDYLEAYISSYIVMIEAYDLGYIILGDTFMRKIYTVFDMDQEQIGFAVAAVDGPEIEWDWSFSNKIYGNFIMLFSLWILFCN